jgi:hypothetical protein
MSSHDPYLELIDKQWYNIVMMHETLRDMKPIIVYLRLTTPGLSRA